MEWHSPNINGNITNLGAEGWVILIKSPLEEKCHHIAIITDTDSSLPFELSKKYGIIQVPILIQFGERVSATHYEINNDTIFTRIDREGKLPTTAAPSPGQFVEAFTNAFDSGADEVLCLNISSEMSATYASARQAAGMLPGNRIEVLDTRSLAMGQGYMVLAAAEAVAHGASVEEAIAAAEDVRSRTYLFGALATLKYIAMSGRVSHLAASMAGLLDIKPVLTLQNGKLELLEKIRTQSKSWNRAIELSVEKAAGRKIEKMAIHECQSPESSAQFRGSAASCHALPGRDHLQLTSRRDYPFTRARGWWRWSSSLRNRIKSDNEIGNPDFLERSGLFYNQRMDNSRIVFIHGSSGDKSQTYKARLLRETFPGIVTPDFDGDLSERMAHLRAILGKDIGWILIGSSLGGLMAALFTMQAPGQVRKLVLLAPALTLPEFAVIPPGSIDIPTIIVQGTLDELISLRTARELAEKTFTHLTYLVVDDDHRLHKTAEELDWKSLLG